MSARQWPYRSRLDAVLLAALPSFRAPHKGDPKDKDSQWSIDGLK